MKDQNTIHEKLGEGDITILPPEEEKEILKQLQDPNLTNEEKNELVEKLYEGIKIEE